MELVSNDPKVQRRMTYIIAGIAAFCFIIWTMRKLAASRVPTESERAATAYVEPGKKPALPERFALVLDGAERSATKDDFKVSFRGQVIILSMTWKPNIYTTRKETITWTPGRLDPGGWNAEIGVVDNFTLKQEGSAIIAPSVRGEYDIILQMGGKKPKAGKLIPIK